MITPEPWCVGLRPLEASDAAVFASWGADAEFCARAGWTLGVPMPERAAWWSRLIAEPPADLLRLAALVEGEVVGYVDLHGSDPGRRELGFLVGGRTRWGRGLGTAIARAGLDYGFHRLGLASVWTEAVDANPPSVAILAALGMRETRRGDHASFLGQDSHYRVFEITREEFVNG